MLLLFASWFVRIGYAYVGVGLLLLPWWHLRGLRRLDATAASGSRLFRALISPGLVALWPWLIRRGWSGDGTAPTECNPHRGCGSGEGA